MFGPDRPGGRVKQEAVTVLIRFAGAGARSPVRYISGPLRRFGGLDRNTVPNGFPAQPVANRMDYPLHYYDLVLLAIISSVGAGVVVGFVTSLSMTLSVSLFGVVAIAFVGHALFVNGPVDDVEDLTAEVEPEEVPVVAAVAPISE